MKRREFLSYCVAAGMTIGLSELVSCISPVIPLSPANRDQLSGLLIADAHAHPYPLHSQQRL